MLAADVDPSHLICLYMAQLAFDRILMPALLLVEQGAGGRAKAMCGDFVLSIARSNPPSSQGSKIGARCLDLGVTSSPFRLVRT